MKKQLFQFILLLVFTVSFSQENKIITNEIEINSLIKGTLFSPENANQDTKLVIMIAGSGPTNRNGNQLGIQTNCSKYLAEGLAQNGIAVFSYDKRIIAQMIAKNLDEKSLSFDDFINDAKDVIAYFKLQKKYPKIIIAGHSEGSLIGMVASLNNTDGFISLEGAGRPIDEVLIQQISEQQPKRLENVKERLTLLKQGKTFDNVNPYNNDLFRNSIQPYMVSWIKYNPQIEIAKLQIPILIINGTKDLQTTVNDAELMHKANPKSELKIIENMNHLFKEIKGDIEENKASYNKSEIPVMPEIIADVTNFVKTI